MGHGGIERRIVAVLPRLRDYNIDAELVCLRERGPLADDVEAAGIPLHVLGFRRRWDFGALARFTGLITAGGFQLVHAHMYRAYLPATVAAWRTGVPIIGQVHNVNTWTSWRQRWMDRALCRQRAAMLAVSERVAEDVRHHLRLPRERVQVLYNGIDLPAFRPRDAAERRASVRAALGIDAGAGVAICPARLHPQKNHAGLLEAWAGALWQLEQRAGGAGESWHLLLAGDGPARPEVEALIAKAESQGMRANCVHVLGHRDDMVDLYHASDLMVLPSFKEGFSNAVIEAMAAGLPVIATDVGGNAEAIEEGVSGVILPPGDTPALTRALCELMTNAEQRQAMARGAWNRAEHFSIDEMIRQTASIYRTIVSLHPRR
jgi:glycosyltransferase involved in cell wall biosynthesis